jgi:hypothetical protein
MPSPKQPKITYGRAETNAGLAGEADKFASDVKDGCMDGIRDLIGQSEFDKIKMP